MPDDRRPLRPPEVVISHAGTTARLDGSRLQIVRDRTTWVLPLQALESAELAGSTTVRVGISGDPDTASRHGLGAAVHLQAPNADAAEAFLERLRQALPSNPAANGHDLVRKNTAPREPSWPNPQRWESAGKACGLAAYMLSLVALGMSDPYRPEGTGVVEALFYGGFFSLFIGPLGLAGGTVLWRVGRRLYSLRVLRARGISVVGTVTGYVRIWTDRKSSHYWKFSTLSFDTLQGQRMQGVPSIVTVADRGLDRSPARAGAPVDITYDPLDPTRASRPLTAGFLWRTLLLAVTGMIPASVFAAAVLVGLLS